MLCLYSLLIALPRPIAFPLNISRLLAQLIALPTPLLTACLSPAYAFCLYPPYFFLPSPLFSSPFTKPAYSLRPADLRQPTPSAHCLLIPPNISRLTACLTPAYHRPIVLLIPLPTRRAVHFLPFPLLLFPLI